MRAIEWVPGALGEPWGGVRFIDQTKLPLEEVFIETDELGVIADAIRELRIRGAPAIGIAAAFGLVLAVRKTRTNNELRTAFERASSL
ncbi:MAG: S-methyl-5-thioribose-1-phosphate isomerase, partial [Bacteroidota bacterium]